MPNIINIDPEGGKGGGGGGGGGSTSAPHYYTDLLILLTENILNSILRVFSDGKLVYTIRTDSGSNNIIDSASTGLWTRMTFYDGSEDQIPDAAYEAAVGIGNAPAYRGRSTVYIEGIDCGQGGQVPNLTFEISQVSAANPITNVAQTLAATAINGDNWNQGWGLAIHKDAYWDCRFQSWMGQFSGSLVHRHCQYATENTPTVTRFWENEPSGPPGVMYYWGAWGMLFNNSGPDPISIYSFGYNAQFNGSPYWEGTYNYYITNWRTKSQHVGMTITKGRGDGNELYLNGGCWGAYDHTSGKWVVFDGLASYGTQRKISGTMNSGARTADQPLDCLAIAFYSGKMYIIQDNTLGSFVRICDGLGNLVTLTQAMPNRVTNAARIKANEEGVFVWYPTAGTDVIYKLINGLNGGVTWETKMIRTGVGSRNLGFAQNTGGYDFYATETYCLLPLSQGAYGNASVEKVVYAGIVPATRTIASVVSELCIRSGLTASQIDVTGLSAITQEVRGVLISQASSTRSVLEHLASVFFFDVTLSDKLYFRRRGRTASATIPYTGLGAGNDEAETIPFIIRKTNELEVANQTAVSFPDIDADYETSTQYSGTENVNSININQVTVPIVLSTTEGKLLAEAIQTALNVSKITATVKVSRLYCFYEVGDILNITDKDGRLFSMRIGKVTYQGPVIEWELTLDDNSWPTQSWVTTISPGRQTDVIPVTDSELMVLDIPMLSDSDNDYGVYTLVTNGSSGWPGAGIYMSRDNISYELDTTIYTKATIGITTTALGDWTGPTIFDEVNTVTVAIYAGGTLSSTTRDALLENRNLNLAVIRDEIIQYRTATLVQTGIYTLSGLLRGRRGTEWLANSHTANENFALYTLAGAARNRDIQFSDMGQPLFFKAPTVGQSLGQAALISGTATGAALKIPAPVDLRYIVSGTDIIFTWKRVSRFSTTFCGSNGISVPMRETAETYDLEIWNINHTILIRSITGITSPTYTYTAAMQTADFGFLQTNAYVKLYQTNNIIGRGHVLKTVIPEAVAGWFVCNFNGVNGSQAIVDSSTSNRTITVYGNTHITTSTFAEGNASGYFDGSGDYLTVPGTWHFGSGNFTIGFKVKFNAFTSPATQIVGLWQSGGWSWLIQATSTYFSYTMSSNGSGSDIPASSVSGSFSTGVWYTVTVIRANGGFTIYVDGVPGNTVTTAAAQYTTANPLVIGRNQDSGGGWHLNGYMDNLIINNY